MSARERAASLLTQGLTKGYVNGKPMPIVRGSFAGQSSHIQIASVGTYHDEWFVSSHSGGGQELVRNGVDQFTRVYAGGTLPPDELANLSLTPEMVNDYLVRKIAELGDQTRLFKDCRPDADGDWQYSYKVRQSDSEFGLVFGSEAIFHKMRKVHAHYFILAPIK